MIVPEEVPSSPPLQFLHEELNMSLLPFASDQAIKAFTLTYSQLCSLDFSQINQLRRATLEAKFADRKNVPNSFKRITETLQTNAPQAPPSILAKRTRAAMPNSEDSEEQDLKRQRK